MSEAHQYDSKPPPTVTSAGWKYFRRSLLVLKSGRVLALFPLIFLSEPFVYSDNRWKCNRNLRFTISSTRSFHPSWGQWLGTPALDSSKLTFHPQPLPACLTILDIWSIIVSNLESVFSPKLPNLSNSRKLSGSELNFSPWIVLILPRDARFIAIFAVIIVSKYQFRYFSSQFLHGVRFSNYQRNSVEYPGWSTALRLIPI